MVNNGNQAERNECSVDWDADCVFGVSPELLYPQILLHPLEEQLHRPAVIAKESDF